jgi:hypothetical protein
MSKLQSITNNKSNFILEDKKQKNQSPTTAYALSKREGVYFFWEIVHRSVVYKPRSMKQRLVW